MNLARFAPPHRLFDAIATTFCAILVGYLIHGTCLRNAAAQDLIVSEVDFSRPHGFYSAPIDVSLRTSTEGAVIRCTTNGTAPTSTIGFILTDPIHIDGTTVLRAAAFRDNWQSSRVVTTTYIFVDDIVKQTQAGAVAAGFPATWGGFTADYGFDARVIGPDDLYNGKYGRTIKSDLQSIPAISIAIDNADMFGPNGIYANPEQDGDAWERPVAIELINPDGGVGFQENAGLRIHGASSRDFNYTMKKSFRVVFRQEYGPQKLHFPLFGSGVASNFQNIVLRANMNDAWPDQEALYVRDWFAMESMRAMGGASSHVRPVHLFINGLYWGVYHLTERPDAAFSASYYGGDRSTWDAINEGSVSDGNLDAWNRLLAALDDDLTENDVYQRLQGNNPDGSRNPAYENLIDVDNMIDYLILNFYNGNIDWPERNWWVGRNRNENDGFKFYPWDSEGTLNGVDAERIDVIGGIAYAYSRLRSNADFKLRFADHIYRHFFNGGAFYVNAANPAWDPTRPTNNVPAARLFILSEQMRSPIVAESARWGDQKDWGLFTRDEYWLIARSNLLSGYFPQRSAIVFRQFQNAGLYPTVAAPRMSVHGGTVEPGFQLTLVGATGTIFYSTDGIDPRAPGTGTISSSANSYTGPILLNDITTVKARALDGTEWSALDEAQFIIGKPNLILSELHYHPTRPTAEERAAGFFDDEAFEYIELWNNGTATYNLANVAFTKGVQFAFADSLTNRLAPNQYILVVADRAAFEQRYGFGLPIAGVYTGHLDNSGERLQLMDGTSTLFDFTYGTNPPWPTAADGNGSSLEPIRYDANLSIATNWQASSVWGGTPGRKNPPPPPRVEQIVSDGATLHFSFAGKSGAAYVIMSADSLSPPQWQLVKSINTLTNDSPVNFFIDLNRNVNTTFFRVSGE